MMLSHSIQKEDVVTTTNNRRHCVSFQDANNQIHEIPRFDDDNDNDNEDLTTLWISRDDMFTYKREMAETLYLFNLKELCDRPKMDEEYCLRGIEPLMRQRLSTGRRRIAMSAVFQVQTKQRRCSKEGNNQHDPEVLAKVYRAYSSSSLADARLNAIQDQQDSFTRS
jgi:Fe-S-cluster formation regulator IscX/YfhJ